MTLPDAAPSPTAAAGRNTHEVRRHYGSGLVMAIAVLGALVLLATVPFQLAHQAASAHKPTAALVAHIDTIRSDIASGLASGENLDLDTLTVLETTAAGDVVYTVQTNKDTHFAGYAWADGGGMLTSLEADGTPSTLDATPVADSRFGTRVLQPTPGAPVSLTAWRTESGVEYTLSAQ